MSVHPSLSEPVIESLRRRNVTTTVDFITADSVLLEISTGLPYTVRNKYIERKLIYLYMFIKLNDYLI